MSQFLSGGVFLPDPPKSEKELQQWAINLNKAILQIYLVLSRRLDKILQMGLAADIPTADGSMRFYWATDTDTLYFDDGAWTAV